MLVKILPFEETAINKFLETPGIKVQSKHASQSGEKVGELTTIKTQIAIFYETADSDEALRARATIEQDDNLNRLLKAAMDVREDQQYIGLKNSTQRRLFLLAKHNLPACDADIVIEILKPEMAGILGSA